MRYVVVPVPALLSQLLRVLAIPLCPSTLPALRAGQSPAARYYQLRLILRMDPSREVRIPDAASCMARHVFRLVCLFPAQCGHHRCRHCHPPLAHHTSDPSAAGGGAA